MEQSVLYQVTDAPLLVGVTHVFTARCSLLTLNSFQPAYYVIVKMINLKESGFLNVPYGKRLVQKAPIC